MQADSKTYNGWTNYETWAVALHLDNDQGTYEHIRETGALLHTTSENPALDFADWLKGYAETLCGIGDESDNFGIPEPSLLAVDMLRAALSEVDWNEIAHNVLSES